MTAAEVAYLCDAANRYFRERVDPSDVVRTVSGANAVLEPAAGAVARDGAMMFDRRRGKAPLLTMFGGDVTTARLRAERAVSKLTPFYPMSPRWTAQSGAAGRRFSPGRGLSAEVERARERWRFLEPRLRRGAWSSPTARGVEAVLGDARDRADLGQAFGPELTGGGGALSHGQGMGAFPRRHSVAALQTRPDHAGSADRERWRRSWRRRCDRQCAAIQSATVEPVLDPPLACRR